MFSRCSSFDLSAFLLCCEVSRKQCMILCMPFSMPKILQDIWIELNTTKECCFTAGPYFSSKSQNFNHFTCFHSIKNIPIQCNNLWDFWASPMALTHFPGVGFGTAILILPTILQVDADKETSAVRGKSSQKHHSLARNWATSSLSTLSFWAEQ